MLTLAPLDTPRSQVGEAMDKDKSFWDHGTWKEEDEADEDYEFEDEKDEVDSDFDISEEDEDTAALHFESSRRGRGKNCFQEDGRRR